MSKFPPTEIRGHTFKVLKRIDPKKKYKREQSLKRLKARRDRLGDVPGEHKYTGPPQNTKGQFGSFGNIRFIN